jgi:serine protease Do
MKQLLFICFLAFLLAVSTLSHAQNQNFISSALPSVVKISATPRAGSYATEVINGIRAPVSTGSGFVISSRGFIITNYHVIKDAKEVWVTFYDGQMVRTRIVGTNVDFDLAILQPANTGRSFQALNWGDSSRLRAGDQIFIIGNPLGLEFSVSQGIVSHPRRSGVSPFYTAIQTDAALNQGNSGGPIFNARGEVVGVAMGIATTSNGSMGLGFAIPANVAKTVADQLIRGMAFQRRIFGADVEQFWEVTQDSITPCGIRIKSVIANGLAQRNGVQAGDVIIAVNNEAVRNLGELLAKISSIVGDFELQLLRNGQTVNVNIVG